MSMPKCSRPATVVVAGVVLAIGVGWLTPSAAAADQAKADDQAAARDREIRDLVASLNNTEVDALKDPKSKERAAIEKLQKMSEHAAPAIATMLADGHKNRKEPKGWIQVYRPLYILKGMGEHAKVALPDVIKALDDQYGPVAGAAAEVLGNLGPRRRAQCQIYCVFGRNHGRYQVGRAP